MDALNDYENMGDMIAIANEIANTPSSYLDGLMLETAMPSNFFAGPAAAYGMEEPGSGGPDTWMPDVAMETVFLEEVPMPISGESGPHPTPELSSGTMATSFEATNEILMETSENATVTDEDSRTSVNFDILDSTQARFEEIPQLQALYDAYQASYTDAATPDATRMTHAKALAFALLKHYYPESQGYVVEPSSLGPVAGHGLSFILAADNGSDIFQNLPNKKTAKKKRKGGRLSKKQKEAVVTAVKVAEDEHGMRYVASLQWDRIEPEDITGFVVLRRAVTEKEAGGANYEYRPHTYLAIMIDRFDEMPRFSTANITHRSDVLADALCLNTNIREGYGILLYGPRLEFYSYEAGAEWIHYESDDDTTSENVEGNAVEDEVQDIEPAMQLLSNRENAEDMALDMRTASLEAVDQGFRMIASMRVFHVDDTMDPVIGQQSSPAAGEMPIDVE